MSDAEIKDTLVKEPTFGGLRVENYNKDNIFGFCPAHAHIQGLGFA